MVRDKKKDTRFGTLAISKKIISEEQLKECLKIQKTKPMEKIGSLLYYKGYISKAQIKEVLELQDELRDKDENLVRKKKRDYLFGKLVVAFGFSNVSQVNECFGIQKKIERKKEYVQLKDILTEKGYVTIFEVEEILQIQKKKIMQCPECKCRFLVLENDLGEFFKCEKCGENLLLLDDLTTIDVDSNILKQIKKTAKGKFFGFLKMILGISIGKTFYLKRGELYTIGRDETAKIQIPDSTISRKHCILKEVDNNVVLRDLKSKHGTLVNGKKTSDVILRDKDLIKVGQTVFEFKK